MLYEIADDVHWLMLTDVKHIKKSMLCAQLCTLTNATYEQTADLSLYTWLRELRETCHLCDTCHPGIWLGRGVSFGRLGGPRISILQETHISVSAFP